MIVYKTYEQPPVCTREILRYAGCRQADASVTELMNNCLREIQGRVQYKVCYRELSVEIIGDLCDFGAFRVRSKDLAQNLHGSRAVILFAATVGVELDRLIAKYGRLSPSKALMFQAIGTERIEALCDAFCRHIRESKAVGLTSRFSPGYGDLSIEAQKDVFAVLSCEKQIGLTLSDSFLMSPSKSVTAFVGIGDRVETSAVKKCRLCDKTDCSYRGAI